jgi:hypothetical protein
MFYRQRTYELTNNGVRSSEEVHVECMVIQQSCVRSSQSRDVECWERALESPLTRWFAALLSSSLAASPTDNPLQCLALVQPLSNRLILIYRTRC